MNDSAIRRKLVYKGLVRPAIHQRAEPGKVIAVRRTDDRPVTQHIPVAYKQHRREELVLSSLRNYGGL